MSKPCEPKLVINAVNINQGGGLVLLNSILKETLKNFSVIVLVDDRVRFNIFLSRSIEYKYIRPTIFSRFLNELWLYKTIKLDDAVLCFGNLPPLFKLLSKTTLFLQNRYLVDQVSLKNFSLKTKIRLSVERLWLKFFLSNVDEVIVQTSSMKKLVESKFKIPVKILPFRNGNVSSLKKRFKNNDYDFIYVASFDPHKNHKVLIDAWHLLARDNIFPSLLLTLKDEEFYRLSRDIAKNNNLYQLDIRNAGHLNCSKLVEVYKKTSTLIYPSTIESFGLPLLEAKEFGLSVIASELDFVRDLIVPDQTFNPLSPLSIARAVKRHLGVIDDIQSVDHPSAFVSHILKSFDHANTNC